MVFVVLFLAAAIAVVLLITFLRLRGQRVSQKDGRLVTTNGVSPSRSLDLADIGTVIYIPENNDGPALYKLGMYKMGVFDYGGLLILNRVGRMVRVIHHYAGSSLALRPIFEEIAAPRKVVFEGKDRRALLRDYPRSVGFFQLRGQTFWAVTIAAMIMALILIVCLVAFAVFFVAEF